MTYLEFEFFRKTFDDYILKLKKRKEVKIQYYLLRTSKKDYHFSFIGIATDGGKHGIHYNRTRNVHYFGHRNLKIESTLFTLSPAQVMDIPSRLKDGLLNVANNRTETVIKK